MGKGHLQKLLGKIRLILILAFLLAGALPVAAVYILQFVALSSVLAIIIVVIIWLVAAIAAGILVASYITRPMKMLAQAILHIAPAQNLVEAPDPQKLTLGQELVTNLIRQVYDFASGGVNAEQQADQSAIVKQLPIAVLGLDANQKIVLANPMAEKYLTPQKALVGDSFFGALNLSYEDNETLGDWLAKVKDQKVTATRSWERIKLNLPNAQPRFFDMAASFSKQSSSGAETIVAIFDHTQTYSADDNSLSFVALAVHELRTPLTVLRGYIEVFEEEFGGNLNEEMSGFMRRMQASAESLTTFVSNILNVAKVDQDELTLQLSEANWPNVLKEIVGAMQLRASVYGKTIELQVDQNLPSVAVDKISIAEVMNNLLDNAIKYSPEGVNKIVVRSSMNQDGLVETTVQDFGIGIPSSVMPHIFEKFYRNHRSKTSVGGSGLGLYLSKAIVTAHEGNIWARSDENKGSIFGFTILPYSRLAQERKNSDNTGITRSAHGWIKNHSMQRR